MAYQLPGGGGFAPDLSALPPEGGEQAPDPLAAEVDRISSLPEKARLRILGFLPLKSAVMLGMVSRSWSHLVNRPATPSSRSTSTPRRRGRAAASPPITSAPDPNALPPEGGEQAPDPLAAEVFGISSQPSMATESDGGGGSDGGRAKRRRRGADEQGGQLKEVAAGPEAAPVVRISDLPVDLQQRILTRLPLKDAIRSGALAQGWRNLWKGRWSEQTSCLDIHIRPNDKPTDVFGELEIGRRRRLDRFSLLVDNQRFRNNHLKLLLAYAAECRVQDIQIDLRCCKPGEKFIYHLPLSSPLLAHLSLRNITISDHYCKNDTPPFHALEVIRLHSVTSSVNSSKVLALCPRLRILDVRGRSWVRLPPNCLSLRSFRCSANFPYHFPRGTALTDLYICSGEPIHPNRWNETLPNDLSSLTVLTVRSNTLKVASSLLSDGPKCRWDKKNKLPGLKELQLLMHGMKMDNLADIYLLLKSYHCLNLERLFVQLLATCDVPLEDSVEDVRVELPEDSLLNLRMVKVMNFNWRRFEVLLVCFLLRKATSVHKILLVSLNVSPLHVPGVQVADILLLNEALVSGHVTVSKSDYPTAQPFHSEVLIEE